MASPRTDVAAVLKAALTVPKRQFYNHPADVVKLPAVIVQNGDPMIELDTMGGNRFTWNLEVIAATQRGNPSKAVTWCEDIARDIAAALNGTGYWFVEASAPEVSTFNTLDATMTTITVQARMAT